VLYSIAIPAYKSAFLKECIASVLSQSTGDFELIIVNDKSPEPIAEIVNLFSDSRIKYFENEKNIGGVNLVHNWNGCLAKAKGDFFIMMGDDDTMKPDYLSEFTRLIEKFPDLDVYHCRSIIIDENAMPIGLTPSWPEFESVYESMWHRLFARRLQYVSDFVYRTSALRNNGGYYFLPLAWASDDITAYIATGKKGIAHTNNPVFNYRHNGLSISSTGNLEKKIEALMRYLEWINTFLVDVPDDLTDRILYRQIKDNVGSKIQSEIEHLLKVAFMNRNLKNVALFYRKRKTYNISIKQIAKSFLKGIGK
jgi:glycosyltransferase involved in cell wall biosynthesis